MNTSDPDFLNGLLERIPEEGRTALLMGYGLTNGHRHSLVEIALALNETVGTMALIRDRALEKLGELVMESFASEIGT